MTNNYTIKYSKRKTMGLYITKNAEIEVRVPNGTPQKVVADFVGQHQQWISTHHGAVAEQVAERDNFELRFGANLLFLGQEFPWSRSKNQLSALMACVFTPMLRCRPRN